ncbi:hypothetical protein THII_1216 [Thioploca ingrica]|uniref:Uncharacterized protein n=1 Tax=Thioploca ingrica TaxID=40754 RepID=A0A090ACN3_9GAMM|nr:hypothetical protein THII_1216 [Thioploca ingrica]
MRFVNLIGVGLVLCELAFPVLASTLEKLDVDPVPDLVVEIFRNNVRLNNVLVQLDIKRECSPFSWQISPWSFPNETYYYNDLPDEGVYSARVQNFQFGSTYGSCKAFFYFNGINQAQIKLNIESYPPLPINCSEIICDPPID